ncbi:hypothetical protein PAAG_11846 [Paracoccidioides lutzii Pb01]|uniref:DUF7730 domain-containing protein n=1 Tax=Paracoccidioides lutzii (strain ATCC MYA-826 / Pb01) TaxID=502779 RepID=A0A0A2V104_PARBA|nr:hypothetical protein PAAG_11846 [Paracoccidioides lutzii Pb01]KGQ01496.1 hypothetical protein PAAG_11846 [Paracoccidioides lutzii Pb01]
MHMDLFLAYPMKRKKKKLKKRQQAAQPRHANFPRPWDRDSSKLLEWQWILPSPAPRMMTCWQAYIEGVDVLYRTNKMHINGMKLFDHLPRLLLPQRLAAIKSAELVWDIYPRVRSLLTFHDVPYPNLRP